MTREKFEKTVEKIKKLMSLSKSNNENEAALAMERAREMMLKYNIDESDFSSISKSDIEEISFDILTKFSSPEKILSVHI